MKDSPVPAPEKEPTSVLDFPRAGSRGRWGANRGAPFGAAEPGAPDVARPDEPVSARVHALRRASLRAVARLHDQPEPMSEECDRATWDAGLAGAYRSIRKARMGAHLHPEAEAPAAYQPPYVWIVPLAMSAFVLALALAPFTAFWETRGHFPPAQILGIPNAPANPLFAALARAWSMLLGPFAGSLEVQLTLFALLPAAALASLAFLFAHRALWPVASETAGTLPFALGVSLLGASGLAVWGSSHGARSAVLLVAALLVTAAWLLLRWQDRRTEPSSRRFLLGALYLAVLAGTSQPLWVLPSACLALFAVRGLMQQGDRASFRT